MSRLIDFKKRRALGEAITAVQYVEQHQLHQDVELVIDLMFAQWMDGRGRQVTNSLDAGTVGDPSASVDSSSVFRLCEEFPYAAEEFRRQVRLHEAIGEFDEHENEPAANTRDSATESSVAADQQTIATTPLLPCSGLKLIRPLGRGGMGVVYLAMQPDLKRHVAVKFLLGGALASAVHRSRFRAEAQAAASLRHPNIVQIDEVGETDEQPYLVMEYVNGGSLEQYLKSNRPGPTQAARFVQTLARAVHEAHRIGVIHRDLKPGNILLSHRTKGNSKPLTNEPAEDQAIDGVSSDLDQYIPKIADFGLAKLLEETQPQAGPALTLAGDLLGTPSYMAPEQASGVSVGPWTDLYSLGAVLYQLLSGRPPFFESTAWETLQRVVNSPAPPLPRSIPRDLCIVCEKCLHKQPLMRYTSAQDLSEDLQRFLEGRPIAARPATMFQRTVSWCRRHRTIAILIGLVSLTFVSLLLTMTWSHFRLKEMLKATQSAKQNETRSLNLSRNSLWDATLSEARAWQLSRHVGQKTQSYKNINAAKQLFLEGVEETPERIARLRDTALAAIPLIDLERDQGWQGNPWPAVDFSFDQAFDRAAQITADGKIRVTENFGRTLVCELPANDTRNVLISNDGRWLALVGDQCRVVQVDDRSQTKLISEHSQGWWTFNSKSNQIVGYDQDGLIAHSLQADRSIRMSAAKLPTVALAISSDSERVAVANPTAIQIFNLGTGDLIRELPAPDQSLVGQSMAWHPNNRWLAAAKYTDNKLVLFDTDTGQRSREYSVRGAFFSLHFDPDGQYLFSSGLWGGNCEVFDVESGEVLLGLSNHSGEGFGLSRAGQTLVLANRSGDSIDRLRFLGQNSLARFSTTGTSQTLRHQCVISHDQRWLIVHTEEGIEFFDLALRRWKASLPIGRLAFDAIFVDRENCLWALTNSGVLRWRIDDNVLRAPKLIAADPGFHPVAVSPDGQWELSSNGLRVKLKSLSDASQMADLGDLADVRNGCFSPNGKWVAAGSWNVTGGVRVWEVATGKQVASFDVGVFCQVKFSPDSRWLYTSPRGGEIWRTDDWTHWCQLDSVDNSASGMGIDFSPDSRWCVVTDGPGQLKIVELSNKAVLAELTDPDRDQYYSLVVSPNQDAIIGTTMGLQGSVKQWNLVELEKEMQRLEIVMADLGPSSRSSAAVASATQPINPARFSESAKLILETNQVYEDLVLAQIAQQEAVDRPRGRWQRCFERVEAALVQIPDSPTLNNQLAWMLVIAPAEYRDSVRSIELARKSLAIEPHPTTWNTLGTALYRNQDYQDAVEALRTSLNSGDQAHAAYDHYVLACCFAELGQLDEATASLNRADESMERNRQSFSAVEIEEIRAFQLEANRCVERCRKRKTETPKPDVRP